jgi:hypothetical protein
VHQRVAFVESFGEGLWIGDYEPNGPAYADIEELGTAVKKALKRL